MRNRLTVRSRPKRVAEALRRVRDGAQGKVRKETRSGFKEPRTALLASPQEVRYHVQHRGDGGAERR